MRTQDLLAVSRLRTLTSSGAAKAIRQAAGVSLNEMATTIGCSVSTLWRWEQNERVPRGGLAIKYARVLDNMLRDQRRPRRGSST